VPPEPSTRFPIRFDDWYRPLSALVFIPPSASFVDVRQGDVAVRMAWAFRADFARAAVTSAERAANVALTRGVHGWAGRWLVNGSGEGLVRLRLSPEQRGFVLGLPVRLDELIVSVHDPDALIAELAPRGAGAVHGVA
jgi:hypothetical protein